jgi:hypothetical protein
VKLAFKEHQRPVIELLLTFLVAKTIVLVILRRMQYGLTGVIDISVSGMGAGT